MPFDLQGQHGLVFYGYRPVARLVGWHATQEDGDPATMIDCRGVEDEDEFFGLYPPTELRLKVGGRWFCYRTVGRVSETQYRVEGKPEIRE